MRVPGGYEIVKTVNGWSGRHRYMVMTPHPSQSIGARWTGNPYFMTKWGATLAARHHARRHDWRIV